MDAKVSTVRNAQILSAQHRAALITKFASKQTYYTIRFLVDPDLVSDAYRAYAYFRWVDDWLDQDEREKSERIAFVNRQSALVEHCYQGEWPHQTLADEEYMLIDLICGDSKRVNGLQSYIRNMLTVMAFDAERRGRLIYKDELANYTHWLATAVTDAMHYFIGHNSPPPRDPNRYLAVTAAHISHMLRDAHEDLKAGYFNIPREFLDANGIMPWDFESNPYSVWVQRRVQVARDCFDAGKSYLAQVINVRCRLAGFSYIARFERMLDLIEQDGHVLRGDYQERKSPRTAARMAWSMLSMILGPLYQGEALQPVEHPARSKR